MAERIRLEEQSKSNASLSSVDQNNSVNANDDVVVAKRRASLVSAKQNHMFILNHLLS